MNTKFVKHLKVGDRVRVQDPEGVGKVVYVGPSQLFTASGGCFRIDADLVAGPNAGKSVWGQHLPGDAEVEVYPVH